ncbi:hypothetical protein BJX65DRAFT_269024 [Aspergillus insuetus]
MINFLSRRCWHHHPSIIHSSGGFMVIVGFRALLEWLFQVITYIYSAWLFSVSTDLLHGYRLGMIYISSALLSPNLRPLANH